MHESQNPQGPFKKKGGLAAWSNVKTALVFIQCGKERRFVHLVLKATETSSWQIFESGLISFRFMMSWVALDHRCANSKMGELDSRCCQPLSSVVRIDSVTMLTSIRALLAVPHRCPAIQSVRPFIKSLRIFLIIKEKSLCQMLYKQRDRIK